MVFLIIISKYDGHMIMIVYLHYVMFMVLFPVIISKYDKEKNINKTVTFLGKGDSFGESAILNNTEREASVISKENVEFLVITHEVLASYQ